MRAQGIYINVSRRNEDVFEMLDDYTQMKDFEDQSKADTVMGSFAPASTVPQA